MNTDEIRYFRDLMGYYGMMIVVGIFVVLAVLAAPESMGFAVALITGGALLWSYAWGLSQHGWNRRFWSRVSEYSHEPILEREEALLDGGEL